MDHSLSPIVEQAVALWGVRPSSMSFVAERENTIFKGVIGGRACALRIRRPGLRSLEEVEGETRWVKHLAEVGLPVPEPIASSQNRMVELVDGYQVDCQSWLSGKQLGRTGEPLVIADREQTFHAIGTLMARLHRISDAFSLQQTIVRPIWNGDGLVGAQPLWGRFWENPGLSATERDKLIAARNRARSCLQEMGEKADYGLIHADMVRENILLGMSGPALIDFDDGGYGYRLFDVATALFKNRLEPDYEALKAALLAGYGEERPIALEALPLFMALRSFTYPGWNMSRMDEPGARERNTRFVRDALSHADELLAS